MDIPDFKANQVLGATALRVIVEELRRCLNLTGTAPINVNANSEGFNVAIDMRSGIWIKLTGGGTGGKYAWTRIDPDTAGAWVDNTFETGTTTSDPAYEANGNTGVPTSPPSRARAWRDPLTNELRFQWG